MTHLERAAKAAYREYLGGVMGCCEPPWEQLPAEHRERLIRSQRAALLALAEAEPSEAMMRASAEATRLPEAVADRDAKAVFSAMLRAAAEEK